MSSQGSLFFYGPFRQRLLYRGVNRDFPKFKFSLSAEIWANKHNLLFVDHSDPAAFRVSNGYRHRLQTTSPSPTGRGEAQPPPAGERSEPA